MISKSFSYSCSENHIAKTVGDIVADYYSMDLESSDLWLAIAILSIIAALASIARRRFTFNPMCTKSLPPVVNSITLLGQLPKLLMRGIQATSMIYIQSLVVCSQ